MTRGLARLPVRAIATIAIASGFAISAPAPPPAPAPVQFGADQRLSVMSSNIHDFVEPAIAASPLDPQNLVAAFFGETDPLRTTCFFRSSTDGGATWGPGGTLFSRTPDDLCADPSVAADPAGAFYIAYLDRDWNVGTDLRVARSSDRGASFTESTAVVTGTKTLEGPSPEKPWIAVDNQPKSNFRGTIYLTYTDVAFNATQNKVMISRDAGRTWSSPIAIGPFVPFNSSGEVVVGVLPVVAPDGTVYVFYLHANQQTMRSAIRFVKSRDGGKSWNPPAAVAAGLPTPGNHFLLDDGSAHFGSDPGAGFDAWSYPTATVTPDGALFVAWTDFPQGTCTSLVSSSGFDVPACVNSDVRLSVSGDGGRSWSAPVKASDDVTQTDQFFPWIASHPNGLVSLVWQDKRLDPSNVNFDLFYTNTGDGQRFLPNVRVSTQSSLGSHSGFIGDYNGLVVSGGAIVPVWNDVRSSSGVEIFTARGTLVP